MGWGRYSFHGAEGNWSVCATIASLALSIIGVVLGVFILKGGEQRAEATDGAFVWVIFGGVRFYFLSPTLHGIQ